MADELVAFKTGEEGEEATSKRASTTVELLVFFQGESVLAIETNHVDSVVPWRAPSPLPLASATVDGVVQDRGRVVVVHKSRVEASEPTRIIICATDDGLLGIPASSTRTVGAVEVYPSLAFDEPVDTSEGVLTILDPRRLVDEMLSA